MCGRFTQAYSWSEVVEFLRVIAPAARNLRPRYNVSPTTTVEVVRVVDGVRELVPMRWGLVPSWWKKPLKDLPSTINAWVKTAQKPMFRGAYKAGRSITPARPLHRGRRRHRFHYRGGGGRTHTRRGARRK